MLLDQARALTTQMADYSRLKSNAGATKDFETRAASFAAVSASLKTARAVLDRLQSAGIAPEFDPNDAGGLAGKARDLRDLVKLDPANLNDPPFNLKYDFVDRITDLGRGANKAALAAWQRRVAGASQMASGEVLSALGAVPQYKSVVARIGSLKQQVTVLASSIPADVPAALAELDRIMRDYAAAWSGMTGDGIPASVVAFLRAAASDAGAPLAQLTQDVESWLETRGLLTLFRIKI